MPVILARTLPRKTLHSRRIVRGIQSLACTVIGPVAVEDCEVNVGVVHIADWGRFAEEAEVPLFRRWLV